MTLAIMGHNPTFLFAADEITIGLRKIRKKFHQLKTILPYWDRTAIGIIW